MLREVWFENVQWKVVKVQTLFTTIRLDKPCGDFVTRKVRHSRLDPEPCGPCGSTGKWLRILTCKFCEGRGHTPNKNEVIDRVVKAAETGYEAGLRVGAAQAVKERRKYDVIDADYTEATPKYVFPEPESHALCGECLQADCEGDCDE